MDINEEVKIENPECNANFISRIFFLWTIPFYKNILNRTLTFSTLPVDICDGSEFFGQKLEEYWETELQLAKELKRKPNLWNALMKIFRKKKIVFDVISFFNYVIIRPSLCILLSVVIRTFRTEYNIVHRCIFGAALVLVSVISFLIEHSVHYQLNKIGMRMRIAVSSLIYRKTLNLSLKALHKTTSEKIIKLLSDDLVNIQDVAYMGSKIFICSIQFMVMSLAMWATIGFMSLTGVIFIITVVIPINIFLDQLIRLNNVNLERSTKARNTLVTETVQDIKFIKMSAWEKPFEKIINLARKPELKNIVNYFNCQVIYYNIIIQKISTYISVVLLFLYTGTVIPEEVFSCSYFLIIFLVSAIYWFPKSVNAQCKAKESLNAITELLSQQEMKICEAVPEEKPEIIVERVCATWSPNSSYDIRIEDIKIKPGSLCIITGPNGSGKTTLLQLLLKEILPTCGSVDIKGSISYCSQKSWLYPTSIRNNILFGKVYRESRYTNILNCCGLQLDLGTFLNGDNSLLGAEVTLTSDQRSRINLARAVYKVADIYLIDDMLSKLDVDVGMKIFEDCFLRYLARSTRLIVTNLLQYFDKADQIIVVHKGRAQVFDDITQLKDSKIDMFNWIQDTKGFRKFKKQISYIEPEKYETPEVDEVFEDSKKNYEVLENGIYEYFRSGRYFFATCIFLFTVQVVLTFCDYWLAQWSNKFEPYTDHFHKQQSLISIHTPFAKTNCTLSDLDIPNAEQHEVDLIVYSAMILIGLLLTVISNGFLINFFNTSAKKLHENMSFSILRAPMQYFYSKPRGSVLNTMTIDVEIVDKKLPDVAKQSIQICLFSIGCLLLILVSNWILICGIFIVMLYLQIQKLYITLGKHFKSLEEAARYPVYSHLNFTIMGLTTIRVNKAQKNTTEQFEKLLDGHSSLYKINLACTFSFAMWSDFLCNIFLTFIIFGLILLNEYVQTIEPAYAGLAILQVFQLITILQYGSRRMMNLVQDIDSVNRIIDHAKLPDETSQNKTFNDSLDYSAKSRLSLISLTDYKLAPKDWPERGEIEFRNVSLVSDENVPLLKCVNFKIKSKEKIGLVGKTNSGKSTLLAALLNLYDFDGSIVIDNINTKSVLLECLRKNISLLQEPVLFSDTVGYNLDPFGEFSDEELWAALEEVEMKQHVDSFTEVINSKHTKFSKGQIQLLGLARIILRKNKIVILDEATANLDQGTEELIYKIVKKKFSDCTVINITNRLNPVIMESDRVLVMESGKVIEFDHPFSLLESEGTFYKLVCEAGKVVYSHYRHMAYQHYAHKFKTNEN